MGNTTPSNTTSGTENTTQKIDNTTQRRQNPPTPSTIRKSDSIFENRVFHDPPQDAPAGSLYLSHHIPADRPGGIECRIFNPVDGEQSDDNSMKRDRPLYPSGELAIDDIFPLTSLTVLSQPGHQGHPVGLWHSQPGQPRAPNRAYGKTAAPGLCYACQLREHFTQLREPYYQLLRQLCQLLREPHRMSGHMAE